MKERYQAYVGDVPEQTMCFVDDELPVEYIVKALETRLKYCPEQKVCMVISAKTAKGLIKALKQEKKEK